MNVKLSIVDDMLLRQRTTADALGSIWFVHAFGESGLCYEELLTSTLGERFNLYVPDFPGFGVSPLQPNRTSLESSSQILIELINAISPRDNIYLVAHSVAGIIGTWAARELGDQAKAYFNIEGNLVAQDAYFTGQVAKHDSALRFKDDFVKQVYEMASDDVAFKRYFASVCVAHPEALMGWGKSAVHHSASAGDEFSALSCAKLYYWGEKTTPEDKQQFIESACLPNLRFHDSGHWPMIDQPQRCSEDVASFFLANAGS